MYSLAAYLIGLSFLLTWLLTPLGIYLGRRWGVLDHPGGRKIHTVPIPLSGGWALAPIVEEDRRTILSHLCEGATSYKEIKDRPALPAVRGWLNGAQQALVEKHAPERLGFPNGKTPKVTYAADAPPHVELRIQELFGVTQVPKLALGRVAPLVHILGPNRRPVQITQDLAGFWRDHYPRVKKELQRKYPKHEWR